MMQEVAPRGLGIEGSKHMPTAKPKVPQVTVAGTKYALSDVEAAIEVLENAAGIMVKQPLTKAGNPLAAMDYHGLATSYRVALPEKDRKINTKPAVLAALRDLVAKNKPIAAKNKPIAAKNTVIKPAAPAA
jgi:hypothetical protein